MDDLFNIYLIMIVVTTIIQMIRMDRANESYPGIYLSKIIYAGFFGFFWPITITLIAIEDYRKRRKRNE